MLSAGFEPRNTTRDLQRGPIESRPYERIVAVETPPRAGKNIFLKLVIINLSAL